jgi:hypothetical protein
MLWVAHQSLTARCWAKGQVLFEPLHYLALLERKPGAFDYALQLFLVRRINKSSADAKLAPATTNANSGLWCGCCTDVL